MTQLQLDSEWTYCIVCGGELIVWAEANDGFVRPYILKSELFYVKIAAPSSHSLS